MSVVLPNGTYVTASRCQHPDLFYAVRPMGRDCELTSIAARLWRRCLRHRDLGHLLDGAQAHAASCLCVVRLRRCADRADIRFVSLDTNSARKFMQIIIANSLKWASEGWGGYIEVR